jgi:hypothetical protein
VITRTALSPVTRSPGQGGLRQSGPVVAAAGCCLLAGFAAAGCGSPAHPPTTPASPPSSAAPPSSAPPTAGPATAAVAAYRGMWMEMQRAGATADWQDPHLAAYASGAALRTLFSGLYSAAGQGVVIKGTIGVNPQVDSVAAARVLVTDCVDDTHWLNYVAATGKLQNSAPGGRHLTEAVVTGAGGRWTVSQLAVRQAGTC